MPEPTFRDARATDLGLLLPLMEEFYREEGIGWDPARMPPAAARLLSDPSLGRVGLLVRDSEAIGLRVSVGAAMSVPPGVGDGQARGVGRVVENGGAVAVAVE